MSQERDPGPGQGLEGPVTLVDKSPAELLGWVHRVRAQLLELQGLGEDATALPKRRVFARQETRRRVKATGLELRAELQALETWILEAADTAAPRH
jgi:hypothetical protein